MPAKSRKSPLLPVGSGLTCKRRPEEEWIHFPVPAIVTQEVFELADEKLSHNRKFASRNNKAHHYLLRYLVSCGACKQGSNSRTTWDGRSYYVCRGRNTPVKEKRCRSRHVPATQLDELVWDDLCKVLTHPEHITTALHRAHGGKWLPQELKARLQAVDKAIAQLERQKQRLLDAYLGGVLELAELGRKRKELDQRSGALVAQRRQLEARAQERIELTEIAHSIEKFCEQVKAGLSGATFEQKRSLVELLIDRVVVTDEEVEIRYVVPTSPEGPHHPFCHLRTDNLPLLPGLAHRRHLGEDQRGHPGASSSPPRARSSTQRRDRRLQVGEEHWRRRSAATTQASRSRVVNATYW